ncbi:hypothetical protein CsSME_00041586 [Camellia sinensis var. sinensis]
MFKLHFSAVISLDKHPNFKWRQNIIEENSYRKNGLKNEIKQRESMWSAVYWELVEPVVKIRTLRARLASIF